MLPAAERSVEVLVIGAGVAGLTAATRLRRNGRDVLLVDKGRGVGGRLASRRIGPAVFDHGAQFMTVRDPRFAATMAEWAGRGVVKEWYRGTSERGEGHVRWRGTPTMTAVAKHLGHDVRTLLDTRVTSLQRGESGWVAILRNGETMLAQAVLLTPPVPQSLALLEAGDVELPTQTLADLEALEYERCLAVLAVLSGPSRVPPPGGLAPMEEPVAWIADNHVKGTSPVSAVTVHATAAFSLAHWDRDRQESGRAVLDAAAPWLGSTVTDFQVQGWRYSKPLHLHRAPCVRVEGVPPLCFAGDAFVGPRVEGAFLSGWAAADALDQIPAASS